MTRNWRILHSRITVNVTLTTSFLNLIHYHFYSLNLFLKKGGINFSKKDNKKGDGICFEIMLVTEKRGGNWERDLSFVIFGVLLLQYFKVPTCQFVGF